MGEVASVEPFEAITDDELTEAALASDPEATVPADARCLWDLATADDGQLLPQWYMPPPMAGRSSSRRWWRWVAVMIIVAFVAIDAYGLCSTYGDIVFA